MRKKPRYSYCAAVVAAVLMLQIAGLPSAAAANPVPEDGVDQQRTSRLAIALGAAAVVTAVIWIVRANGDAAEEQEQRDADSGPRSTPSQPVPAGDRVTARPRPGGSDGRLLAPGTAAPVSIVIALDDSDAESADRHLAFGVAASFSNGAGRHRHASGRAASSQMEQPENLQDSRASTSSPFDDRRCAPLLRSLSSANAPAAPRHPQRLHTNSQRDRL